MNEITVTTQAELDAVPDSFEGRIFIKGGTIYNKIVVGKARGNSSVVARGNSSVEAWENSSVEAWENSSVEARGNSSVVARGNVGVHLLSDYSTVLLFAFSVCWKLAKGKITKKSKTATVITPKYKKGNAGWLEKEGIENTNTLILFKRVSFEFKTQENRPNETVWKIGNTLEHPNWEPKKEECGEGKYHACSRAYFCDDFRENKTDVYVAIEVDKKDIFAWDNPSYPHKIAFRKGKVLYQCDKMGKKI